MNEKIDEFRLELRDKLEIEHIDVLLASHKRQLEEQ